MGVIVSDFFSHQDSFMDYRKTVYEISEQTVKSNLIDLRLFENFLNDGQYETINGPSVMDFQYYLKIDRENCGGSINRKIFTLKSYAHFLKSQDVPNANHLPFDDVLKVRGGYRNRPNALLQEQIKMLFFAIDRDVLIGLRDYAVYSLMYLCGLRVGEVFNLDLSSIDLKKKKLFVLGKGGKKRNLPLSDEQFQILSEYLAVRSWFYKSNQTNALFISKKGNRLAIRTMEDNFKKLVKKSGIKTQFNVTCHTLRHTFASHLNDKDVDMLVIQSLMGHSTSRSTEPYIHPSQKRIREAIEKLPGVIFMNQLIKEGGIKGFQNKFKPGK